MARFITFNGLTMIHPGGATRVDVNALAQVGAGATGIIGLIGEECFVSRVMHCVMGIGL